MLFEDDLKRPTSSVSYISYFSNFFSYYSESSWKLLVVEVSNLQVNIAFRNDWPILDFLTGNA